MSNTAILKLNDGTELLLTIDHKSNQSYICTDIIQILTAPDSATGQMKIGFADFMPYSNGQLEIPIGMAILSAPSDELDNFYREKFGKIITNSNKIVLK